MADAELAEAPVIAGALSDARASLEVSLDLHAVAGFTEGPADMALTAVLDLGPGGIHYHALRHPGDKPDFHDPRGFTVFLP